MGAEKVSPLMMSLPLHLIRRVIATGFVLFAGVLLAFSDTMGMLPVKIAGFKFYGADLLLVFFVLVVLFYGLDAPFRTKVAIGLLIMLAFGSFSLVRGYLLGRELNAAIGDFRRLFLYSLAFGTSWVILDSPSKVKRLNQVAYLAVIPVVLMTLLRAFSRVSWQLRYEADDIRTVSYATAGILFWVFFDACSKLLIRSRGSSTIKNILWVFVVGFTLLISNYRALWLIPAFGIVLMILAARMKGMIRVGRIVLAGVIILLAVILGLLVLRSAFGDIYGLIEQKFVEDVLGFQWNGSFRYFLWGEAWNQFTTDIWLGVGIGHRLQYWLLNSAGEYYMRESTAHNILIDYLYQTGLVGLVSFVVPHLLFVAGLWRSLQRLPLEYARAALALLVTYFSMFALGSLQPYLTIPSVAVLFYIIMGTASRWVYWGRRVHQEELLETRVV